MSWNSKQQEIVVLSTTEGEYVAATQQLKKCVLRSFTNEVFGLELLPTTLFSDNKSPIALSKDHQYHARTKHIDIQFHFIRWIIDNGSIDSSFSNRGHACRLLTSLSRAQSENSHPSWGFAGLRGSDKFASAWSHFTCLDFRICNVIFFFGVFMFTKYLWG